jgi:hypothetical protein
LSLYLIDSAKVTEDIVIIKFGRTVKISSLLNSNFIVETNEATPSTLTDPFKTIETLVDYNQISRTLTLRWKVILAPSQGYVIRVNGLVDAANITIPEEQISFVSSGESATPSLLETYTGTIINQVLVEDKSIRSDIETGYQILAKNPNFYIESINPTNGEYYVDDSENNGRIIVTFSSRPASNFINSKYFKAQRKKIQRTPSRWESVTAEVSMHSWKAEVYIDFPSNDATPAFFTEDKTYFETGYKYRVIVSAEVGI